MPSVLRHLNRMLPAIVFVAYAETGSANLVVNKWIDNLEATMLMDFESLKCPPDQRELKLESDIPNTRVKTCKSKMTDVVSFYGNKNGSIVAVKHVQNIPQLTCNKDSLSQVFQLDGDRVNESKDEYGGHAWFTNDSHGIKAGDTAGFSRSTFYCKQNSHAFVEGVVSREKNRSTSSGAISILFDSDSKLRFGMSLDEVLNNTTCLPISLSINSGANQNNGQAELEVICGKSQLIPVGHIVHYKIESSRLSRVNVSIMNGANDALLENSILKTPVRQDIDVTVSDIKSEYKRPIKYGSIHLYKKGTSVAELKKQVGVHQGSLKIFYNKFFKLVDHDPIEPQILREATNKMLSGGQVEGASSMYEDFTTCVSGTLSFYNTQSTGKFTDISFAPTCLSEVTLL